TAGLTRSAAAVTACESGSIADASSTARIGRDIPVIPNRRSPVGFRWSGAARLPSRTQLHPRPDGGIGRRAGFRYQWWQHRGGSSPFLGSWNFGAKVNEPEAMRF